MIGCWNQQSKFAVIAWKARRNGEKL